MPEVSKAEFARLNNVSRQYIGRIVREGKLPQLENKKLDRDTCQAIFDTMRTGSDRNLEAWTQEQKGAGPKAAARKRQAGEKPASRKEPAEKKAAAPPPAPSPAPEPKKEKEPEPQASNYGISFQKARAAKEAIKAKRQQIELAQLEGKLIEVENAKRQIETIAHVVRTRLIKFPSKFAGRLEGLTTIEIKETMEAGIYEILSEFRDMVDGARDMLK